MPTSIPAAKPAVLVAVSDVFFYTKIRDALLPQGYALERARSQEEIPSKAEALHPAALILNMNDDKLDAFLALEALARNGHLGAMPVLAFANHEEVDTWKRAKDLGVRKIVSRNEFSARTRDLVNELVGGQPSAVRQDPIADR